MTAVGTLSAWGIHNPALVVSCAQATGLPLALACALLEQESHGGENVWGHDGVQTGGAYTKGGPVTQENYLAYRKLAQAGKIGRQGCGPCQLTAADWQDAADARGGCWDVASNLTTGFTGLVTRINRYGLADGVRRYNGSGPAAERYRDQVLGRYRAWTTRLAKGDEDVPWTHSDGAPPVPDFYRGPGETKQRPDLADPLLALAYVTTHAAYARDLAGQALDEVRNLRNDIAALRGLIAQAKP